MIDEHTYLNLLDRIQSDLAVDNPNCDRLGKLIYAPHAAIRRCVDNVNKNIIIMNEKITKNTIVETDEITTELSSAFDYSFSGESVFVCNMPEIPKSYKIGLIVGPSGSGKSSILQRIGGNQASIEWDDNRAIASHFESSIIAQEKLSGVGLNSIPSWMRPYHALSNGEQFRANLARAIDSRACIDEFTSVVDRTVAKSCAYAVKRQIDKSNYSNVTFATCHYDIIEWLQPCWVYDTKSGGFLAGRSLWPPERTINIVPCNTDAWAMFSRDHYLTENINKSARCWVAEWEGKAIGFVSAIAFPNAHWKNGWREHRTVCLSDYQGMGFGVRISDAVAQMFLNDGCRYFSKTAHPRMGEYRESSKIWSPTTKNKMARKDYNHNRKTKESKYKHLHMDRVTYSHEYIGYAS